MNHADHHPCVVFGATFGRLYVDALLLDSTGYRLIGLGGQGGRRTLDLARHASVPWLAPGEPLPADARLACVVVRSGLLGGRGSEIVERCLRAGIDVVQEHPVHQRELASHVRLARQHGARYYLNTFYDCLPAVVAFVRRARELQAEGGAMHLELWSSYQVAFAGVDLLSHLGSVAALQLDAAAPAVPEVPAGHADGPLFRRLSGRLGSGMTVGMRVDMSLDPRDPDEHPHLLLRAELVCRAGTLMLADAHGPVLWLPRPRVPDGRHEAADPHRDRHACLFPAHEGGFDETLRSLWPGAIASLLKQVRAEDGGMAWLVRAQRHLDVCGAWSQISGALGLPALMRRASARDAGEVADVA
ncbi:Gfo/Idh/MocA family oxidoreductase [Rubrivivax sp. RP6-9]|uniref:Gfo/Idh/MocA family oxidoreductase n=1 Tax=Rubrivivax sp. RP6-9 TaxID=3415750 RepID=UPI003CC6547B